MKKVFTFIPLCLLFFFFSCSFPFESNTYSSIVINFGSLNQNRAATYTRDDLLYFVVSIEPKVQKDIKVDFINGETKAVFRNLVKGTYKITVSAFNESDKKIAYGESGRVEVNSKEPTSVRIKMEFLSKTDYSTCEVGDFILRDGTILSKDSFPEAGTVAAVIVRAAGDGKPALGVGIVHNQDYNLAWCTEEANGNSAIISGLEGTLTEGYTDGSNGWQILKAVCSDAEEHPEYYPAWNYSLTYAENNDLTGYMAEGWYLPTFAELYTIFQNMETVDASLSKAGGNQFAYETYLSCTVINNSYFGAKQYYFDNYVSNREGDSTRDDDSGYSVCTVKAFN